MFYVKFVSQNIHIKVSIGKSYSRYNNEYLYEF
jgi:hypothetical protein